MSFDQILVKIDDVVWGLPTIVLILVTGLVLTIRTRGIQFTKLGRAFKTIFRENEGHGELSGFAALCTALSATIGTGNIVGVATAILGGGPGALFWMWFAAILGTATKYAECMLAIKYREVKADGTVLGGPFYTIEKGMGKNWKWLAVLFAVFGTMVGLFGIGTFTQVNGITGAVQNAFDPQKTSIAFYLGYRKQRYNHNCLCSIGNYRWFKKNCKSCRKNSSSNGNYLCFLGTFCVNYERNKNSCGICFDF